MKIPPETVAAGLLIPEGPVALSDGPVLLVEVAAGRLDGAAIGPDGIVYVWNKTAAASAAPAAAAQRHRPLTRRMRLYWTDTHTGRLWCCSIRASGVLAVRRSPSSPEATRLR